MIMKLCNNDNYREGHAMIRSLQTYGAACTLKLFAALIKQDVEIKNHLARFQKTMIDEIIRINNIESL